MTARLATPGNVTAGMNSMWEWMEARETHQIRALQMCKHKLASPQSKVKSDIVALHLRMKQRISFTMRTGCWSVRRQETNSIVYKRLDAFVIASV